MTVVSEPDSWNHDPEAEWRRVVFASEVDDDGNCPVCLDTEYADCSCPGPSQCDLYEYEFIDGEMMARAIPGAIPE